MKARVKATGEVVEVYFYGKEGYDYVCNDKEECYERGELEILDEPDYWNRLEHQYAGMAMQGILSNAHIAFRDIKVDTVTDVYVDNIIKIAHALVEKYQKEETK